MNMDLLIINPRFFWFTNQSSLSIGPITLASYLNSRGLAVRVIDDNSIYRKYSFAELAELVRRYDPGAIGISANLLNALSAYRLVTVLREALPLKIIIGGGLHSYDSAEEMMDHSYDIVFRGEAELSARAFLDLVAEFRNRGKPVTRDLLNDQAFRSRLGKIPGLLYRDGGRIYDTGPGEIIQDLDELPSADYDLVNMADYIRTPVDHHQVTTTFNFQRGCPHRCIYCKSDGIPFRVRSNSATYMVKEIESRQRRFNLCNMFILDSNFSLDARRTREFCERMAASAIARKVRIMVQSSVTAFLSDEDLAGLKRAGVTIFNLGIERFDDEFRRRMKKAGTKDQAVSLIRRLHDHGFKVVINVLLNFPFETEEALQREAALLDHCRDLVDFFYINYIMPIPGTPIYDSSPKSRHARWYLRADVVDRPVSYYNEVYLVSGPALSVNPFGLPPRTLCAIRRFKEHFHRIGAFRLSRSPVYRTALAVDLLLGKVSGHVANYSTGIEHVLFRPLKLLRAIGYKVFFRRFVSKEK